MSRTEPTPWSVRGLILTGLVIVLVFIGGFAAWSVMTRISGAVVASGQVEVEQQRQIVQHPDGGVVSQILVSEGDEVEAGQVLLTLDGALLRTEHVIVEAQYFEVVARRGRLEAERANAPRITFSDELMAAAEDGPQLAELMAGQTSLFTTRADTMRQSLDQLATQVDQLGSEAKGIDAQAAALTTQRGLIEQERRDQQSLLDRGLAQITRVLALEREAAGLDGQLGALDAQRASVLIRQAELEIQRLRLVSERHEQAETELRDLGPRELELAERRRSLIEQIGRLEIRAPVSGRVYNMQVTTPRSVVRPAEPLLYVIPQDRPLVIGVRIATINIDEVQLGQPAILRFPAFASRSTPEIEGRIDRVSADVLIDEATRMPYYRAEVSIAPDQLEILGNHALLPGMPAEVYLQTGDRSPLAYLVKPLADYFNRAFRES